MKARKTKSVSLDFLGGKDNRPLIPNAKTIAAMNERRGESRFFVHIDELGYYLATESKTEKD